jgi:hypothetical protein
MNPSRWQNIPFCDLGKIEPFEDLERSLYRLLNANVNALLLGVQIQYSDSTVTGHSITKDWYSRLFEKIFSHSYFQYDAVQGTYRINQSSPHPSSHYRAIGTALGISIIEEVPTGADLNFGLLKILLYPENGPEVEYTRDDMMFDDYAMYRSVRGIEHSDDSSADELWLELFESLGIPYSGPTEDTSRMIQILMLDRYRESYFMLRRGFHEIVPLEVIQGLLNPDALGYILQGEGSRVIPVDELRNSIDWEFHAKDNSERNVERWFWDFIKRDTSYPLKLVRFATGLRSLPVGGLRMLSRRISIILRPSNPDMLVHPEAKLCYYQVTLPIYPSREKLESYVAEALESSIDVAIAY